MAQEKDISILFIKRKGSEFLSFRLRKYFPHVSIIKGIVFVSAWKGDRDP